MRVGLTGGIGSGKSTVCRILHRLGAHVLDADTFSHAVTAPDGLAVDPIRRTFGPRALAPSGGMDRDYMRELIFAHPDARHTLESIIHPLVRKTMQTAAAEAEGAGKRCVVLDIPLLVESGHWREYFHQICVVDCSESTQLHRVRERNGWTKSTIAHILAAQANRSERLKVADIVIVNDSITQQQLVKVVRECAPHFGL